MKLIPDWLSRWGRSESELDRKQLPQSVIAVINMGTSGASRVRWDDRALLEEGFQRNAIVYRCIIEVARSVATPPLRVMDGEKENAALSRWLARPNPLYSRHRLVTDLMIDLLLYGNAYLLRTGAAANPRELWLLPSPRMRTTFGTDRVPVRYELVGPDGQPVRSWPVSRTDARSEVLHLRVPGPVNDRGRAMPPLVAAAIEADQFTEGGAWNRNLLMQGASLSGVLQVRPDTHMSDEQFARLSREINEAFSGARNAGKVPVIEGAEYKPTGAAPRDMLLIDLRSLSARLVCQTFGVPPFLLGLAEGATFNNVAESRLYFWDTTVLPLVAYLVEEMAHWLWADANNRVIEPDLDDVPALEPRREARWDRVIGALKDGLITVNEAREEVGYDPVDGGNVRLIPSSAVPVPTDGADGEGEETLPDDATSIVPFDLRR